MKYKIFLLFSATFFLLAGQISRAEIIMPLPQAGATTSASSLTMPALTAEDLKKTDVDRDGLNDYEEINIYRTNPIVADTDNDGFNDGDEIKFGFDPNRAGDDKLQKIIIVDLKTQELSYSLGPYQIAKILVSTGVKRLPTPPGEYAILKKIPAIRYRGANYNYPNTKWNLMFKQQKAGNLYIHGAYWHHNFGHVMSHGCVNVSYADVEPLYNWADVGTKVVIQ